MQEFYRNNKVFIDKLLLLLAIAVILLVIVFLFGYIAPFVAGYVISLILSPLVGFVHRKWRIPRGIASAMLILILLAGLGALGTFLVGTLIDEMAAFAQDIPNYIASLQALIERVGGNLLGTFGMSDVNIDIDVLLTQLITLATGVLQGAVEGGGVLIAIPYAILRILLTIISAFFFIKDKEVIKDFVQGLLPERLIARAAIVRDGVVKALVGYAKGQLIVMAYVSTISVIGLLIIGSQYSLFIGIGIGFFDLIPIFGAGGIFIPWAVFSFLNGNMVFGVGLLVIYGIIFIVRQVREPKVVGDQMGIHPLILLMSVYVGITTLGPVGILAGPLITLTIKIIMESNMISDPMED